MDRNVDFDFKRKKIKLYSEIKKTTINEECLTLSRKYKNIYKKVIQAAKPYDVSEAILSYKNVT